MKSGWAIFLLLALSLPSIGSAQTTLRPDDAARLDGFTTSAGNALLQALSGGDSQDIAALTKALSGAPQIAFDETLSGDWRCRTMKLGGISPLVVYTPFGCRITATDTGFGFEKLTGSQRTKGTIFLRNGRAIYAGVGYVAGETVPDYADLPADFTSDGRIQSDVAVFERISPTRARLMFPSPAVESDFDILELTR
ncbi:DUF4893 domain-containing protein [Sulfitobacter aestuariivivens]|uniref:DUF4893 domain-containing protein n=1 Tax=Sulfitobacter aestuariivivens TaxID=2766981 RepID=A0A927HF15_9RHOB|nr:DUF4893 domain-containing protein [Sulfitobacter aestuariivivens]MBD3663953.1 DUF4893 domain-containing protein [Sulfitobacter aestuariivivens]